MTPEDIANMQAELAVLRKKEAATKPTVNDPHDAHAHAIRMSCLRYGATEPAADAVLALVVAVLASPEPEAAAKQLAAILRRAGTAP